MRVNHPLIIGLLLFMLAARGAGAQMPEAGTAAPIPPAVAASGAGIEPAAIPLDLRTSLEWTLARNPDLIAQRQNLEVSEAALELARHFPTSLNPTVTVDVRPWVFGPPPGGGLDHPIPLVNVTWAQPIELGHRTGIRTAIAQAAYTQTRWTILQAELTTLVETYRDHQTALYRRAKLEVARQLYEHNERLLESLGRQVEANRAPVADLVLAGVESQATRQVWESARQEYQVALADLRRQMGIPEYATSVEPSGQLLIPHLEPNQEEAQLLRIALESHPQVHAAEAQAACSQAALELAQADRIPISSIGPVYERNEAADTFYGVVWSTPVPLLNAGGPLVRQRESEHHRDCTALAQLRDKVTAQVKATLVKWQQIQRAVERTEGGIEAIRGQAARMERLYAAGQTDVVKLLQVRDRLIEAENARLDVLWQATQAYAELLNSVGSTTLLGSLAPKQP
ncbi:MAG: TolC family protein [Thermoguttaceae bacterium]